MALPEDPFILLSYVNTKLRDECESLDDFCDRYGADKTALLEKLGSSGFKYSPDANRFA
ncbi:MAG: DUF4250 domain-containing protein [Butyrivibrio sp.]|nr:DUF4250 domain-containing protein [Butyrivibrio sp.]